MATRMFVVATLIGMLLIVTGCKGDGHSDHDHANMSMSPAAPNAVR